MGTDENINYVDGADLALFWQTNLSKINSTQLCESFQ